MLPYTLVLANHLFGTLTMAAPKWKKPACRGHEGDKLAMIAAHEELAAAEKNSTARYPGINVDVYMHVLLQSKPHDQNLTLSVLKERVDDLNTDFEPANISFTLRDAKWVTRNDWRRGDLDAASTANIQRSLRRGGPGALNIYFVYDMVYQGAGLDGAGTYPSSLQSDTAELDGCVIGKWASWNHRLLTHEVGHWFGLLHTFNDICNSVGDCIDDTLPSPQSCHDNISTCPNADNFMSYGKKDARFTPGQMLRLQGLWARFRSGASFPRRAEDEEEGLSASSPVATTQTRAMGLAAPSQFSCAN